MHFGSIDLYKVQFILCITQNLKQFWEKLFVLFSFSPGVVPLSITLLVQLQF